MNAETSRILSRLLASNESPDEAESRKVQESLIVLQSRISQLQSTLVSLKESARQHKAVLSPIRSLPTEILVEIFLDCWQQSANPVYESISLSSVCRKWRSVALGTPALWSDVPLSLPTNPMEDEAIYWQTAQELILRSQFYPLRIHMTGSQGTEDLARTVQGFLNAQSHRWKSVVAEGMLERWSDVVESAPLLEELELNFSLSVEADHVSWLTNVLEVAPHLRRLRSIGMRNPVQCEFLPSLTLLVLPGRKYDWGSMAECDLDHFLHILESAPCLEHFIVLLVPSYSYAGHFVTHTRLQVLELHFDGVASLLPWLTLPALRELSLVREDERDAFGDAEVFATLKRSSCALSTFRLRDVKLFDPDTIVAHLLIPEINASLTTLEFDEIDLDPEGELLNLLICSSNDVVRVPNLSSLSFPYKATASNARLFRTALMTRWSRKRRVPPHVAALKRLTVVFCGETAAIENLESFLLQFKQETDAVIESCR